MSFNRHIFTILLVLAGITKLFGQPYFDLVSVTGWNIPQGGTSVPAAENYITGAIAAPVKLGENKLVLFKTYYEQRTLHFANEALEHNVNLYGTGIPVTLLLSKSDSTFKQAFTVIGRFNATEWRFNANAFQIAAAYLATWRLKPNLHVQLGIYYSREFFSDFFLPLAGIDWRISKKVNFFGVFPNAMRLEFNPVKNVFVGADFKSVLNSYRSQITDNSYWKVLDNHLGLFAEYALNGRYTLYAGSGISFLRKITTMNITSSNYPEITGDQYYLKAGMYFRIREKAD
ncbi:MAG TPA: hypothetical protein VFW78_06760 [Bacteroidia bacterium]|nr:hypothetical protein [Bacteroidia bacterium]